jgi:hypothetical protein
MTQIEQTNEDLQNELKDQIRLLELHCKSYDEGHTYVARHIATLVRVLVHDTDSSHSLLGQLGIKQQNFFDSSQENIRVEEIKFIGAKSHLAGGGIGQNSQYIPYLDSTPHKPMGFVIFDDWWNRSVLIIDQRNIFSRSFIILKMANQAGGAHVDTKLDEKYYKLTKSNLMGVKTSFDGSEEKDMTGIELAIIRQIGHELLKTLKPNYYQEMVTHGAAAILGGIGGVLTNDPGNLFKIGLKPFKVGRNEKCPCGSQIKYKKCHGK